METEDKILTRFNAAYAMQQHEPKLVESLLATDNKDNEIVQALSDGAKQFKRDKIVLQQRAIKDQNKLKTNKR